MRNKPLPNDKVERIIELKLEQVPVKQIAETVGCAVNTVQNHWHKWLDETTEQRREHLERHRSEVIANLVSCAQEARRKSVDPDLDPKVAVRYLAEARHSWRALSTVAGFDAPTKVEVASFAAMTEEEAAAALDKL